MTAQIGQVGTAIIACVAALWAAMLALAQESRVLARTLGDGQTASDEPAPTYRAMHVARIALLLVAAAAAAETTQWWTRPPIAALIRLVITCALLYLVAESIPRGLGVLVPNIAQSLSRIARASLAPFAPLVGLVAPLESRLARLMPSRPGRLERFGPEHHSMLDGVLSLADTTVAEAMTPRLDIVALDVGASWREAVDLLARGEHVRLPVYREDLDNVVGILYAKDLTPAIAGVVPPPDSWQDLIRPAQFVPESKTLTVQLRDFQRGPSLLAIVVDEFGGTSGLITLEDVLEEVVGEIHGEYDVDERPAVEREGDDRFWVDGSLALDDLSQLLGTDVESEEVATVGGLVYSELGRVPKPGEELRIDSFRVVVEQVVRRRIKRVYFERTSTEADDGTNRGATP
ncbi:MAG: HlyC/CorC family transporter [Gemmatimonadota bacterium]|nr:MAG: HlyC/CorC family transporter [Gemmatimonadota bacterium]